MKKYLFILLVVIFSLFVYENANAGVYIFGNIGSGGEVDDSSIGGEIGATLPTSNPSFLLGIGISVAGISKTERISDFADREFSDEWEGYGAVGIRLISGLYLVGTAGYSQQTESITLHAGGVSVEGGNEEVKDEHFTASGQLRYVYKSLIIGGGYHNRRGIIGGIGFAF